MKQLRILCLAMLATMSCRSQHTSKVQQLFEQSSRRDPIAGEDQGLAKLDSGCTAFFVENAGPSNILVTARHCTDEQPETWCQKTGHFTTWDGREGQCSAVLFAADDSDIVLFTEAAGKYPESLQLFQLDPARAKPDQALQMIGYPNDRLRKAQVTVSENCQVKSEETGNPHAPARQDPAQMHNCSTYGGNSGGPLFKAHTRSVVGLPITYLYNYYELLPSSDPDWLAYYASISGFLKRFAEQLKPLQLKMAAATDRQMPYVQWPEPTIIERDFAAKCEEALTHSDALETQFKVFMSQLQALSCLDLSQRIARVSEINLANRGLSELDILNDPIFHMGQLKALYLSSNPLSDIKPITGVSSLVLLDISSTQIKSLGIGAGSNLEILFANSLVIKSLDAFMGQFSLPTIKRLYFKANSISDASSLKLHKTLRILVFDDQVDFDKEALLTSLKGQDSLTFLGLIDVINDLQNCPLKDMNRCAF